MGTHARQVGTRFRRINGAHGFRSPESRRRRPHKKVVDIHPAVAYNINVAFCDRGGIGIRARLRGVSDKGTGSSPVDRTKQETHPAVVDVMTRGVFVI